MEIRWVARINKNEAHWGLAHGYNHRRAGHDDSDEIAQLLWGKGAVRSRY